MVSAMGCAWETASLNVTASFGQNMNCWIVTFRPIGFEEQLISDTTSSLEGNLRGVFSEGEIHCLGRLRRDSLLERLSRP